MYSQICKCICFPNRSQKTSHLQRDSGLFLSNHGLSRSGQSAGHIMGDSVHRRSIDSERKKMVNGHGSLLKSQITTAIEVSTKIILYVYFLTVC